MSDIVDFRKIDQLTIENEELRAEIERLRAVLLGVAEIGDTANPASALARRALEPKP